MNILDDEVDTDEFFRDKDANPIMEDDEDDVDVRELIFDSKFASNANFKDMAEDFTATDEWE